MSDYHEMFLNYVKGLDPDIVARIESDMLDSPPQPQPYYENHCWTCGSSIDDQKQVELKPVVCLKCGVQTLQGEKCCDEPIHNKV